jgi:hypothetical protein
MLKKWFKTSIATFLVLWIAFVPFTFNLMGSLQKEVTHFVFGKLITTAITSDSKGMYKLVAILLLLALIIGIAILATKKERLIKGIKHYSILICIFYLATIFLKYGFDKVFKTQFYHPEPNTLFTKLGNLDKDILYWSTIGSSYWYNVIIGCIEVLAAILLLFKRTRQLGIVLLLFVLAQIVLINFAFDISVKLFSLILLIMTLYVGMPYFKNWFTVLLKQKVILEEEKILPKSAIIISIKCFVIGLLFLEALYPYLSTKNFNDDKATRPFLHGAYQVTDITATKDTLQPNLYPFKRFFIHRNGYIIFEDNNENMQDYALQINTIGNKLILTNYYKKQTTIPYHYNDSTKTIVIKINNKTVTAKAIDYKKMNLLNDSFNWVAD